MVHCNLIVWCTCHVVVDLTTHGPYNYRTCSIASLLTFIPYVTVVMGNLKRHLEDELLT